MSENGTNQERTEANTAKIIAIDNKVNADSALITNNINNIKASAEGLDSIGTDKSRVGPALRTCSAATAAASCSSRSEERMPPEPDSGDARSAASLHQIRFVNCLDLYHTSPDSGERQYEQRT